MKEEEEEKASSPVLYQRRGSSAERELVPTNEPDQSNELFKTEPDQEDKNGYP